MSRFELSSSELEKLKAVTRRRKVAAMEWKRARYLILLHEGCDETNVCQILEIRRDLGDHWRKRYERDGLSFLRMKDYSTREGHLITAQEEALKRTLREHPMGSTNEIRDYIRKTYGQEYSRSGCIKLMHRLGFEYKKPEILPRCDEEKQRAFIEMYEKRQKYLPEDEIIYFGDAVHPDHQVRPAHGWFYHEDKPVVPTNSGRKRVNIHGAVCLETFDCPFVEAETINADTAIAVLELLEANNPDKRRIHLIWDNARYHHAKKVREWLERPECRIKIIWLPTYSPHLNSIERLWGVMHKYVTHNKFYKTYQDFRQAILSFFTETIPKHWRDFRDTVTDNFRVISTQNCQIIG